MSQLCQKILTSCISIDCENPIYTGIDATAYIFNRQDIKSVTYDPSNPNLITEIEMVEDTVEDVSTPRHGYKIQMMGRQPYANSTTEMSEGNVRNRFNETVQFMVMDHDAVTAEILDNLVNGRYTIILHNEYKDTYQIYGYKKPLICSEMSRDPYSDDDGAWVVSMVAKNVPNSALFVEHKTNSEIDTQEYLEGLVSCE